MSAPAASAAASDAPTLNKHSVSALQELSELSSLYQHGSLSLLLKVLSAVTQSPAEPKFRRVNAVKLLPKLRTKAGLKLLESLGFKHPTGDILVSRPSEAEFMILAAEPNAIEIARMQLVCEQLTAMLARADSDPTPVKKSAASASASASASAAAAAVVPASLSFREQSPQKDDIVEDDKFVFFWHAPGWPAQWTQVPFVIDGVRYCSPEQWMMASKARLFGDHSVFAQILMTANPREAKSLGRKVKNFDSAVWDQKCLEIVVQGNMAKFTQHPEFGSRLLATGNKILVEASPLDAIWGIGLAASNPDSRDQSKWQGTNLLGKALMQVRDNLRQQKEAAQAADGVFQ